MKKAKLSLSAAVFLGILILAVTAASVAKPTGTWLGKLEVPGFGSSDITLALMETKSGYAGTINDSEGWWSQDSEIAEVKLEGDKLSFSSKLSDGTTVILFRLTVAEEVMTGEVENTAFANPGAIVSIEFTKKK